MRIDNPNIVGLQSSDDLVMAEQADHSSTPTAGYGYLWVKNDTPNKLVFTDDAGTDYEITPLATGGGAPFGANVVIGSGGDYATLTAYAGNDVAGDIVYIQDSHTLTGNTVLTASNLQIYQAPNTTIDLSTYYISMSTGTGLHIHNLKAATSSGGDIYLGQSSSTYENITFDADTTTGVVFQFSCSDSFIRNIRFSQTASDTGEILQFSGDRNNISYLYLNMPMSNSIQGSFTVNGVSDTNFSHIYYKASVSASNGTGMWITNGDNVNVTNSYFEETAGNSYIVEAKSDRFSITNCVFDGGRYAITIDGAAYSTITGNVINCDGTYAIFISTINSSYCSVTGNIIEGSLTAGIRTNAADYCAVNGNVCDITGIGVLIDSGSDNCVVVGNNLNQCTTPLTDNGTGTLYLAATDSDPLNKV